MLSQTEWVAIVLLGIGIVKMIVGFISPKHLLDVKRNKILKYFLSNRKAVTMILLVYGVIMVYFSLNAGIGFAQWFVAGMTFYILMMGLLFSDKHIFDGWLKAISKMPENHFRVIALAWLIFSVIGLYLILY